MSSLEKINLTRLSETHPTWVTQEEYDHFKMMKTKGWSHCDSGIEWLVKLHYLRTGFKDGKIKKQDFFKREQELVLNWWRRWC